MKKNAGKTAARIKNGLNVKEYLPEFLKELTDNYHYYAGLQFAIHYYNLYENIREGLNPSGEAAVKLNEIAGEYLSKKADMKTVLKIKALRDEIIERMEAVSAFTDVFTIYEYILNRMELKYTEPAAFDDEEETRSILKRVFSNSDNAATNLKIQMMLSQLPVRMTRAKFMDIVEDSLALYENSGQSSVNKLLYMVRSASGLYKPESKKLFPELLEIENEFSSLKFKTLEETEYVECCEKLETVCIELNELSEYYNNLQEAVNQLYVLLLTSGFATEEAKKCALVTEDLTTWINGHFEAHEEEIPEELVDLFLQGEGEQERLSELLEQAEPAREVLLDRNRTELEELGLMTQAEALEYCSVLISASLFVRLDEEESPEIADRAFVEAATKQIQEELNQYFEEKESVWKRAVMAAVLKELPVFFASKNEVTEYIRYSFENCRDYSEKRIAADLLHDALEEFDGI